ncbi:cellulose biosynthesis cyclic di-GMP-binding regulatory protein BcsB [Microvirga antarctica]|uniref:cellulose biosynthesis cyclic di-GMP-binding regulatory protein BcsB n=1 Tax=Microvirga antarctica TaxID=2819233 RepID=UPI001B303165|nr:cellulose biosynthesis cyclic di-GMP-binding regulatory protein BcsB [Microvirga antarctica]
MRPVLALAFAASLLPLAVGAAESPRRSLAGSVSSLSFPVLESRRALPIAADEMDFVGEAASHEYPVYLTANEATRPAKLKLAYLNAISVLPETFHLTVKINDVVVGETTKQASSRPGDLSLNIPAGLLEVGFNSVRISVRQSHRVDCSAGSTYELWTRLLPDQSELTFTGGVADIRELRDLPAVGSGKNGSTPIRVKVLRGSSSKDVVSASRAVQSAVLLGQYTNPVVEFDPSSPGVGGLDIIVGQAGAIESLLGQRLQGSGPRSQVLQGTSDGRVTLAVTGANEAEIDAALEALAERASAAVPVGSPAGLRALKNVSGRRLQGGESATLNELGLESEPFRGRLSRQTVKVQLPPDFLAADYGRVTLTTDAVYAPDLSPSNKLIVRVNGTVIADASMANPRGDVLKRHILYLPTGAFKSGLNTIDIEAETRTAGDARCDAVALLDQRERFLLAGSSEITVPTLARIGALPNISSAMSGGLGLLSKELSVFIPKGRSEAIDASLTVLAKMASVAGHPTTVNVGFEQPPQSGSHVLAIGAFGDVPDAMLRAAELDPDKLRSAWQGTTTGAVQTSSNPERIKVASMDASGELVVPSRRVPTDPPVATSSLHDQLANTQSSLGGLKTLVGSTSSDWLTRHVGSVFATASDIVTEPLRRTGVLASPEAARLVVTDNSTLVIAQGARARDLQDGSQPGFLPSIESTTVIVAPSAADLVASTSNLLTGSLWQQLVGQAAVFDSETNQIATRVSGNIWLSKTAGLDVQNVRLIAAGWLSRNVPVLLVALLAVLLVLTMLLQRTLRTTGVREP